MKDQIDNAINSVYVVNKQKKKALKALEKAKQLEKSQGKKPIRLNPKTIVLR